MTLTMAVSFNEKISSPYYPRRARWYGRFLYLGAATRNRLALDRIRLPQEITLAGLILGFLIPGLAVYIRGPRLLGRMAIAASALLFLSFIVWLGYPFGNYAFGLMLSIHVSGFVYYCTVMRNDDFWHRLLFTLAILLGLGLFLYAPMRGVIQSRWLTPLNENGHVIVVQKHASPGGVRRGDWVMYSLPNLSTGNAHGAGGAVRVQSGFGWGSVLAVAGDYVAFSTNSFSVNGIERSLLPHMPTSGNLVVREKSWFVWPELDISGHGNTSETVISATMVRLATVPEDQFVGKPFKRWFWRKQILQ